MLYVRGERGVGKSQVVNALELGFSLLSCRGDFVLVSLTGAAADNIGGSTIHTCLSISVRGKQGHANKVSSLWTKQCALIVDEISMVDLEMLSNMARQLAKAKGLENKSTAVFGGLPIIILMRNFYQFSPVVGRPLWEQPRLNDDHSGKMLWECFNLVLTLTQQMQQRDDQRFTELLQRARAGSLTEHDITMLNDRVVTQLTLDNPLKNTVIV